MALLHEEIKKRYLNYALSVIMSRALPDARDGMKPVQRRILYAMSRDMKLNHDSKFRKSAAVVGFVMGRYHAHGDSSIYDTMCRMAQDFSLRYPLVDGQGNFGSIDGDNPASMRYTEVRLQALAGLLSSELHMDTVGWQSNYDNTTEEPLVLPAQFPNLLVNGATGIAVGMATNIPPHNLGEVIRGLRDLLSHPDRTTDYLVRNFISGPDFPTGGLLLESVEDIVAAYEKGSGSFTVRSKWHLEEVGVNKSIIITEIPYATNKDTLIQKIAEHINGDKLPQVTDLRDESADDIRIVFDLKRGTNPEQVLAYLFKYTGLEAKFHMNLTCLVPAGNRVEPKQVGLKALLRIFLDFRYEVTQKRLEHTLKGIQKRLHILDALEKVFGNLQHILAVIQDSTSKATAKHAVMTALSLDETQAESIVEMPLYRLATTEKQSILDELKAKRGEVSDLEHTLGSEDNLWKLVGSDLKKIEKEFDDKRRTKLETEAKTFEYNAEDFIESEDVFLVATRDGWVRTQKSYGDVASLRCREGDEVGWVLKTNTKSTVSFFTTSGKCYTTRVGSIIPTNGYGDPLQAVFSFEDGEKVANVLCLKGSEMLTSITRDGLASRYASDVFLDPSTVAGRTFHRLPDKGKIVNVLKGEEGHVVIATHMGRGITFDVNEIPTVKTSGKGVKAISLKEGDLIIGCELCGEDRLFVETNRGNERMITGDTYKATSRARKGYDIVKRGTLVKWVRKPVESK